MKLEERNKEIKNKEQKVVEACDYVQKVIVRTKLWRHVANFKKGDCRNVPTNRPSKNRYKTENATEGSRL